MSAVDIRRSCRFIGTLMKSLCTLPGGRGRFVPCAIGANHCRLLHVGWEQCGLGLASGPRDSASEAFLNELLQLFRYHPRSAPALLEGTLHHEYCAVLFADRVPIWRLPVSEQAACLVTAEGRVAGFAEVEASWVSGSGPRREFDKTENPLHTSLVFQ